MSTIRRCRNEEWTTILTIINAAAQRYRGAIPADCWHEPYMTEQQLGRDISAGVTFWASEEDGGELTGVMGFQQVKDVTLIRHAYVRPDRQGRGIGGALLQHLETLTDRRILIGTWADASWAIRFYESHGYRLIAQPETPPLLCTYWDISPRQVETSVVLAKAARAPRASAELRGSSLGARDV
jgi:GNAT superfamily N-acetyltransferase